LTSRYWRIAGVAVAAVGGVDGEEAVTDDNREMTRGSEAGTRASITLR
jgi:hypothetical protein